MIVDYYSRYPEVAELRDTKSLTIVNKCKSVFSRNGIPEKVVSDKGPQYVSLKFERFEKKYSFDYKPVCPKYPLSGQKHKRAVQTVKSILKKCKESNHDPYMAVLDYKNTIINCVSPAQALTGRNLWSNNCDSKYKRS